MDEMLKSMISASPSSVVVLISLLMFLRHMKGMTRTHAICLEKRDRTLQQISKSLTKSLDKNTKATNNLDSTIAKYTQRLSQRQEKNNGKEGHSKNARRTNLRTELSPPGLGGRATSRAKSR